MGERFDVSTRVARGAIVRTGEALDSDYLATLDVGTQVKVFEAGATTDESGTVGRLFIVDPCVGWVSESALDKAAVAVEDGSPCSSKWEAAVLMEFGVASCVVTLNRPKTGNALSREVLESFGAFVERVHADTEIRLIVIRAKGAVFCAGGDLTEIANGEWDGIASFARDLRRLYELPTPVIAVVDGPVYGGGLGILAVADIVLCTARSVFQFSEVKLGLIPAAISPYVVEAIGVRQARRYFLTAEKIDAQTAEKIGLVTEVCQDKKAMQILANKLADQLTQAAPRAVAAAKLLVTDVAHRLRDPSLVDYTVGEFHRARLGEEAGEGVKAVVEKREPRWATLLPIKFEI